MQEIDLHSVQVGQLLLMHALVWRATAVMTQVATLPLQGLGWG